MSITRTKTSPTWFAATLLFESSVGKTRPRKALFEKQIVLFRKRSKTAALNASRKYGRNEEISYENMHGQLVQWHFVGIEKLEEISNRKRGEGWEVASSFDYRAARARLRTCE